MNAVTTEQVQLRHVELDLQRQFGHVPPNRIHDEVQQGLRSFQDARVRTYVPVLLQKRVRDRLRGRR